jgi:hypothetical protein
MLTPALSAAPGCSRRCCLEGALRNAASRLRRPGRHSTGCARPCRGCASHLLLRRRSRYALPPPLRRPPPAAAPSHRSPPLAAWHGTAGRCCAAPYQRRPASVHLGRCPHLCIAVCKSCHLSIVMSKRCHMRSSPMNGLCITLHIGWSTGKFRYAMPSLRVFPVLYMELSMYRVLFTSKYQLHSLLNVYQFFWPAS